MRNSITVVCEVLSNTLIFLLQNVKRVFGHMMAANPHRSGPSPPANIIIGYDTLYEWRAKARIVLCACTGRSESAHFAHARRYFLLDQNGRCRFNILLYK